MGATAHWRFALLATMIAALGPSVLKAQDVAQFYRGKQIELVSGGDTGTLYDTWARVVAQFLPRYVPGSPAIIVKFMPGAGHIKATNYLYSVAPKDGSSVGMISQGVPTVAVLRNRPGLEADFDRFHFLGSTDKPSQVCVAGKASQIQSGRELFSKELTVGGAGAGSGVSAIPIFLRETLGMKFKLIEGYKSAVEVLLAIERGEVDGMCQTYQGVVHGLPNALQDGRLKLLFNLESEPIQGADAPTIRSLISDPDQVRMITFFSLNSQMGRPMLLPPGTPADRVAALQNAFDSMVRDPEYVAAAMRQGLDPSPSSGRELRETFRQIAETPKDVIDRAAKFMQ